MSIFIGDIPVTNMVPVITRIEPTIVLMPIASSKTKLPQRIPNTGMMKVTDRAEGAPSSETRLK